MQRLGFHSSKLPIALSGRTTATRWRSLSNFAAIVALSVSGMLGCSSEPETPAVAQNAAPGAQAAAPGMQPGMAPGMQPAGMPGAMPGGAPMPPGAGAATTPGPMAQMAGGAAPGAPVPPSGGAAGFPMPPGGGAAGAPMPPGGGAAGFPMPPGAGAAGAPMPPGGGAAGFPMPPGAGAARAPMPPGGGVAGAPMAQPGAAGLPGGAEGAGLAGGQGGGGVSQNPTAQVGTAEYSAQKVVLQLLGGELSGLEEFISPKCKGMLGDVRDGKATDQQKEELKKLFNGLQATGKPKLENGAKVITVRNADGAIITFKVKKEGDDQKVTEMTVKQSTTKRR